MKVKEFIQMVSNGEFWSLWAVDDSDLGEGFELIETLIENINGNTEP